MALYLHVGPYSRDVIGRLENIMVELEADGEPRVRLERESAI